MHQNVVPAKFTASGILDTPFQSNIKCRVGTLKRQVYRYFFPSQSGVRHICHNVISQVSLSRDDVVFAVLEVPVSLQSYFITRGCVSKYQQNAG